MRKALLLLFLFLSLSISAQVNQSVTPYQLCSIPNLSGFAYFDLTSKIPEILQGQSPTENTITFHISLADSETGSNPIATPTNYISPSNPFMIYVRVVNNVSGGILGLTMFQCEALPIPTANPATLSFCDMMELAIYDLSQADAQITSGATGLPVTYHETLTDAQIGANPVGPLYVPLINPGTQTLYARVFSPVMGCSAITTLTLNTHNCGDPCPTPTNLVASTVTDTSFAVSWTNTPGSLGVVAFNILILPSGSPTPNENSTGYVTSANPSPFIFTGLSPNACYTVYVKTLCSPTTSSNWSEPLNICMPNCADSGACSEALILNAFLDSNNNGVKDTGELNFNQGSFVYQVNDSGDNQYGTSNNGSYYIFDSNPNNSYDINFVINSELNGYYTSSVSYNNVTLPDGSGANYLYFPIVNILPHVDAQVYLSPYGQPRPGFTYINTIYYQNNGLQTIANGTLTFTHAPNVSISSVSQPGVTTTSTGFTYDFTNLAPNEGRYINVALFVPTIPTVNLGDLVTNSVTIQITDDINLSNNTASITQSIIGSYDPNDMTESHGGKIVHGDFTSNDYLYYTIQFENTGTASAEFVKVEDTLDNQLDESTFEIINASHNMNTKRNGNQLTWHFYDINLPPTSSNPSGSHGYINFRIKPKAGYAIGDIIPNTASIYFDYNPPITTNTFDTEFVQALGNTTFDANTISLFPNPASDRFTIINNGTEKISKLSIYDITGKRIYTLNDNSDDVIIIDVSHFAKGLYLIELASDNNSKINKKLILK